MERVSSFVVFEVVVKITSSLIIKSSSTVHVRRDPLRRPVVKTISVGSPVGLMVVLTNTHFLSGRGVGVGVVVGGRVGVGVGVGV